MGSPNVRNSTPNESPGNGLPVEKIPEENSDFDRAVSLSLKTAEQEKAIREMQLNDRNQDPGVYSTRKQGRSSQQNGAEVVEQQLVSEESKRDGGSHLQQGKLVAHSDVDDEYLASHLADKEKEMNVVHEAATCQLKGDVSKRIEPMVVYNDKKAKILNITRIQGNSCILDSVVCP
ncbi:uncharacterized protein LOC112191613 [Rosa chinensis]|uniref:uncharacterized protein LOC112191613 n=1 Tax=Rosa chinensis TaxID=74649 RepID=UPI001AD92327|nr:uncharacterized protein LOC112191613 [Rosa chinensis]